MFEQESSPILGEARARAMANVAVVKYWGKRDPKLNLPAVGSISLSMAALVSDTRVRWRASGAADLLTLNGAAPREDHRMRKMFDALRQRSGKAWWAEVESHNDFPTAAGLASSASGYAAMLLAGAAAMQTELTSQEASQLARLGSGSAARSIFGGFVSMQRGERDDGSDCFASALAPAEHWPLRILIAVTSEGAKAISSGDGMRQSALTSPFYDTWCSQHEDDLDAMRAAIMSRDFERFASLCEASCLKMHAVMLSTQPALLYWKSATMAVMHEVVAMRGRGLEACFTIDAGAQVKVICSEESASVVGAALQDIDGVLRVISSELGGPAYIVEPSES